MIRKVHNQLAGSFHALQSFIPRDPNEPVTILLADPIPHGHHYLLST